MPSIMVGGNNITDRVFMLRQAMWVMIQIIEADVSNFASGPATAPATPIIAAPGHLINSGNTPAGAPFTIANSYPVDVTAFNLTKEDVALLGIFLNIAKTKYNSSPPSSKAGLRYDIEVTHKDVGSNFAPALIVAPPGTPRPGAPTFNDLLTALSEAIGGMNKVNRLIDLIEVTDEHVQRPVGPLILADTLTEAGVAPVPVPPFNTISTKPVFHAYDGRPYNIFDINELYTPIPAVALGAIVPPFTWNLLLNTVTIDVSGAVHLVASRCSNSFFAAQIKNIDRQTGISYQFDTDKNGLLQLKQYNGNTLVKVTDYNNLINKVTKSGDYCKAFGGSGRHGVCSTMVADCLGDLTHDEARCRVHFQRLPSISKNIIGWSGLKEDEKRYFAYRVLLGLGIFTRRDKQGNPTYLNDSGGLIYSDADIISTLNLSGAPANGWYNAPTDWNGPAPVPGTPGNQTIDQLNAEKVEYIKKMMILVNTITLPAPSVAVGRPEISQSDPASNTVLVGAFMPAFPLMLRPMIGGDGDESNLQILYGGNTLADMGKILHNIRKLLDLSKSAINPTKVNYIDKKLKNFHDTASEIDQIEQMLTSYIILKNRYPNKELIFTDVDIQNLKATEELKKKQFANRFNKINKLHTKLLQIRN
jgi:hypothetical protein